MAKQKRRLGDRRDGALVRDSDAMHVIVPMIHPNRCDNEAYISVQIDLTRLNAYLKDKNENGPEFRWTMFHAVTTALLKAIVQRPLMNRFIASKKLYQRHRISAAFTVKKKFSDSAGESLAFLYADPEDTIFTLRDKLYQQINLCRSEVEKDQSTDSMETFTKIPRFILKPIARFLAFLERHGKIPKSIIASDPYQASVLISNVGSIGLQSGYHHLTNWGTTSIFCLMGKKQMTPFFDEEGHVTMRETIDLGLTIDERIADGYYYAKTVTLLKKYLENPELLELPLNEDTEDEKKS